MMIQGYIIFFPIVSILHIYFRIPTGHSNLSAKLDKNHSHYNIFLLLVGYQIST